MHACVRGSCVRCVARACVVRAWLVRGSCVAHAWLVRACGVRAWLVRALRAWVRACAVCVRAGMRACVREFNHLDIK